MRRINKIHAWQVVEIEAIPLQGWSVLRRLFHPGTATKNSSTRPRRNVAISYSSLLFQERFHATEYEVQFIQIEELVEETRRNSKQAG